jgi:hypothetical protein
VKWWPSGHLWLISSELCHRRYRAPPPQAVRWPLPPDLHLTIQIRPPLESKGSLPVNPTNRQ